MRELITVIGARPQFIKAAAVSRRLREAGVHERLLHTGQHYDPTMSQVFFDEMEIPAPAWHLETGGGSHGRMTAAMLAGIEAILIAEKPEAVMVYGDTNSTLAGALAAAKLHIPVIHVEAGLRSFNRRMPEEINRVMTDHLSATLFCSSETGRSNLAAEGITAGVEIVGDVMNETLAWALEQIRRQPDRLRRLIGPLADSAFRLMTLHRAENTDTPARLASILSGVSASSQPVVLPLHPRTRSIAARAGIAFPPVLHIIEPVGYLDMIALLSACSLVLTDSGGLQKEAYWAGRPCLTLRDETEWIETVGSGWNRLVGADTEAIREGLRHPPFAAERPPVYGEADAAVRIAANLAA